MKIAEHGPDLASLQQLVDHLPALIHTARPDGYIDFFNERWLEYVGLRLEDLEGWKWTAAIHPDDVSALVAKWRACLASGEPLEFESRVRRADGAFRWMLHQKRPLRDASGEIVKWYGSSVDIDDRKRAEFEVRKHETVHVTLEAQLQATLNIIPAYTWYAAPSGALTFVNQRCAEYFGLPPDHPLRFGIETGAAWDSHLQLLHPDDHEDSLGIWSTCLRTGEAGGGIFRARSAAGAYRWFLSRVEPLRANDGTLLYWIGVNVDIEEQKQAEVHLAESEETFRLVVDGIAGLVTSLTPRGDVDFINQPALAYFGKTFDELKNWQTNDALHPADHDRVATLWGNMIADGQPYDAEYRLRRRDGIYRWFHARARPLRDAAGAVVRWYVLLTDLDERKQAEQRLKEQEAELRQILDLSHQLVGVLGPARERLHLNQTALEYLGVSLDEWRQRGPGLSIHLEDVDRVYAYADRAASTGLPYDVEARVRKYDGSYRWFDFRFNPVRDEQGQIKRWYWACTDIEDRKRAQERLEQENVLLREEIDKTSMFEEIVGASAALKGLLTRVSKVAASDSTVLINGETGTGKELVARAIHRRSTRSSRAFVAVNCAAIPRDLIASELFGHEKGAFTGAVQRQLGRFELADRGTIFLDEVGELSPDTQVALLRVLQEREFQRVGGRQPIHVDVRVIAATNRDLNAAVAGGTFRQDLFYRLNVFPVEMPPLRERREDIPLLVEYFVDRYARKAAKTIRRVNKRTLDRLQAYPWPGNVRELQNVIERSVIVCDTDEFTVDDSWLSNGPAIESRLALSSALAGHEKAIIEDALRASGGRVFGPSGAAARLGLARSTLESKIRGLGIDKNRFRGRPPKA